MPVRSRTILNRYGTAVAAVLIAALARVALDPILGDRQPLVSFFLAAAIVATIQGFGPALASLIGGAAMFPILFRKPHHSFALPSADGVAYLALYLLVGTAVAAMCAALRSARARAEEGQEGLRREMARRERAEADLRDRETRWRALIENSSDAVTVCSSEGHIQYVSASVSRISGFTPEDLIGTDGFGHIHPEDRDRARDAWAEVLSRPGAVVTVALRVFHKDGTWRRVENVATNRLDDPAIAAVVINTRDVTERDAMQDRIADSEARFRTFMDHSPTLAYLKDESGRYVWGNRAWAAQFGRPVEELIGLDDFALWPEAAAREFRESDRRARESGGVVEAVEAVRDRHFMSLKFPIDHAGKRLVGGKTLDVTDRVRAEEAVRRNEALLLALADSMPQMVWAATPDGHLDYFNKRWFEYTGFTPEQSFSPEGWGPILHPDDLEHCRETWYAAVRSGAMYQIEYRFKDRVRGGYRWHLGRALPVRDESGRIVRWYGTCTDIDDQKRAEEAGEAANRAKDRFLAVLSHELRTPLTPILLAVSSLLDDPSSSLGEARPALELVRRNVALESRLIDDLLDVTRIVRGTFTLRSGPCDVHALLAEAMESCAAELDAARVATRLEPGTTVATVVGDPARLHQVFANLLKNAVKFSPAGGPVTIRTRDDRASGRLVIEVADAGVGIEPEFLPKVFEAFEQAEASPWTRQFGGLGLGLAICRAIVVAHDGEVTALSDGPGRGSTFRVALPTADLAHDPAAGPRDALGSRATSRSSALRILLIEDDPGTLTVLSRLLKRDRHDVTTADCVASALAASDRADHNFDLIISDIGLPDGNGVDLLRALKARRDVPAIALTGFGTEEDVRRGRDAGFRAHLTKPVDFGTLEAAIREVVPAAT